MRIAVEVCVTSVEEAEAAASCGVDTVEVCSWLACGGITPSSGLVDAIRNVIQIPVRVLIRPSPTGATISASDTAVLLTDAEVFGGGALGLVTGALNELGAFDEQLMQAVKKLAPESEITFHRAIDLAKDPSAVAAACVELGIDRILTSGGAFRAMDGVAVIKRLVNELNGRCALAIAGGVGPQNVVQLIEGTGATEVHFAAQLSLANIDPGPALSSTAVETGYRTAPDKSKIEGVLNALVKAGLR